MCTRPLYQLLLDQNHGQIQRETGGRAPPEKSQKYRVSKQNWSGSLEKSQSYQASIQCWAIIGQPVKPHLNGGGFTGGPMMALF